MLEGLWMMVWGVTAAHAAAYGGVVTGVGGMIRHAGPMVKLVLLVLFVLSAACWCVILVKLRVFRRSRRESESFLARYRERRNFAVLYRESELMQESPVAQVFRAGYTEWARVKKAVEKSQGMDFSEREGVLETVEKAMDGAILAERQRLERFLGLLATTGNTAPFIGLFGTVWGIMTSFQEIGLRGAANLAVVAPGISEALVATAMGLVAAIPAVVAYNHFSNAVQMVEAQMNYFAMDLYTLMKREWIRRPVPAKAVATRLDEVQDG